MALEIDMLSVGNADAIIIQVYDNTGHVTILVDGGNDSDGELVVSHINNWARGKVNLLVNTHPDCDHVDGLSTVVNKLPVGEVLIHDPESHRPDIKYAMSKFSQSIYKEAQAAYKSLSMADDLIKLVDRKRIPRREPFPGVYYDLPDNARFYVVGPTIDLYNQLLAGMDTAVEQQGKAAFTKQVLNQMGYNTSVAHKSQRPEEVLDEKNEESPSNNSSALLLLVYQNQKYLFTADAGPVALDCVRESFNLSNLAWMQVPHHGSRRNLTSELVSYFSPRIAYVSAKGGDDKKHPNPNTVQALKNVGSSVYGTFKSGSLWHHINTPNDERQGYTTATPL